MRVRALLPVAVVVGMLLTGCVRELEGLRGEPRFQSGAMIGVNGRIGSVLLRNVYVEEPPGQVFRQGSQARIYLQLFNRGEAPDELVAVTTPAAGSVDLRRDSNRDGRFEPVASLPLPTGVQEPVAPVRSAESRSLEPASYFLLLRDLTEQLRPGESIPVSFTFERAGVANIFVPVEIPVATKGGPPRSLQRLPLHRGAPQTAQEATWRGAPGAGHDSSS